MKKIVMLNASVIKESSCILRVHRIAVDGYTEADTSSANNNDTEYGSAFHLYRKRFAETGKLAVSVNAALAYYRDVPKTIKFKKKYLNEEHLKDACFSYHLFWENRDTFKTVRLNPCGPANLGTETLQQAPLCSVCNTPLSKDTLDSEWYCQYGTHGKPLVELKFGVPLYSDNDPLVFDGVEYDGLDIIGCGTIDDISYSQSASFYAIKDYKTTASWDIKSYLESYRMSTQMLFYRHVIYEYARYFPNSVISEITKQAPLGYFIEGIFVSSSGETKFERSEVFFPTQAQSENFRKGLHQTISRVVAAIRYPHSLFKEGLINNSCNSSWGPCRFVGPCSSPDEVSEKLLLDNEFIKRFYNPLNIHE